MLVLALALHSPIVYDVLETVFRCSCTSKRISKVLWINYSSLYTLLIRTLSIHTYLQRQKASPSKDELVAWSCWWPSSSPILQAVLQPPIRDAAPKLFPSQPFHTHACQNSSRMLLKQSGYHSQKTPQNHTKLHLRLPRPNLIRNCPYKLQLLPHILIPQRITLGMARKPTLRTHTKSL